MWPSGSAIQHNCGIESASVRNCSSDSLRSEMSSTTEIEVVGLAFGRAGERDGQLDADERLIIADVSLLRRVRRDLPGQESPGVGEVGFAVFGVGDVPERQPHHLIVAVAHDAAERLVDPQPAAVQPDVGDADRRLLEDVRGTSPGPGG